MYPTVTWPLPKPDYGIVVTGPMDVVAWEIDRAWNELIDQDLQDNNLTKLDQHLANYGEFLSWPEVRRIVDD